MIELQLVEPEDSRLDELRLGQNLRFRIRCADPSVETRAFLHHRPVTYPDPLCEWTDERRLDVFPEAPGRYLLSVEWRVEWRLPDDPSDRSDAVPQATRRGAVELELVVDPGRRDDGPYRARVGDDKLWVPSRWESAHLRRRSQHRTLSILESLVSPASVVYDVGANIGVYSCPVARTLGAEGHLYSVEANPVCVHFLRSNVLALELENVTILPVALLDRAGTSRFRLNYGNASLGLSHGSGFYHDKLGHEIAVPCHRLDDLVADFRLRPPDVIKIDIEGAEHLAAEGMRRTLSESRPLVLVEIHGIHCLRATLAVFDACGYRYHDPAAGDELTDAAAVEARFGDCVFQLVARPEDRRLPAAG